MAPVKKTRKSVPEKITDINWIRWKPTERAVLCFVHSGEKILLIRKKTGLGAGKINAPGGRIENGETPLQAAVRETIEEVHVTPTDPCKVGELFFQFKNGYKLHGTVFFSFSHTGEPAPTDEADPFWCEIDKIPYDEMWEDDRHWLPLALDGKYICGHFIFDDDNMIDMQVVVDPASQL